MEKSTGRNKSSKVKSLNLKSNTVESGYNEGGGGGGGDLYCADLGNRHMISPDRTRLISILLSNSRLPGHHSPDLWHWMLIILILLIHAMTRQQ